MKIPLDKRIELNETIRDFDMEWRHKKFDKLAFERLKELDPEFYEDLCKGIDIDDFWYA